MEVPAEHWPSTDLIAAAPYGCECGVTEREVKHTHTALYAHRHVIQVSNRKKSCCTSADKRPLIPQRLWRRRGTGTGRNLSQFTIKKHSATQTHRIYRVPSIARCIASCGTNSEPPPYKVSYILQEELCKNFMGSCWKQSRMWVYCFKSTPVWPPGRVY